MSHSDCPLCQPADTSDLIWRNDLLRVIMVGGTEFPGYTRVIWQQHVPEMTDLPQPERRHIMDVVCAVETVMRKILEPTKVNLAQFGNQVPHLHWHVIPRWQLDPYFPEAIWAMPSKRSVEQREEWNALKAQKESLLSKYYGALRDTLDGSDTPH